MKERTTTSDEALRRWPCLVAHVICHSLGYATPTTAASIVAASRDGRESWCEWIASTYERNPLPAVQAAIRGRHSHVGYMAHYPLARRLVEAALAGLGEPVLASWF